MLYAWPMVAECDREDLGNRINAEDHHGQLGICPLCNKRVASVLVNGVWQWLHVVPENHKPRGKS